ncbi:MAG: hypothetical protein JRN09_05220 [Nitrososphaerota archaeon]|nr:hypothetical protein [Nitrososphaerota archaeon]
MKTSKFGAFGISSSVLGIALLLVTFVLAYLLLRSQSGLTPGDLTASMGTLLYAAIEALFLGIMGWVGSILLLRGIEFMKVEKGVGVVTFKVEKGVGIVTQTEEEKPPESQKT